jgi:protein-S-isoprenylcysteine O-methyltransferase Ste14
MSVFFQFDKITFYLFYIITFLWIFEFVLFPSKNETTAEKKSFFKILAIILVSHLLTIILTFLGWFRLTTTSQVFEVIALIIYAIGLSLRYISIFYLGKYFTRDVHVDKTHELISNGPYKFLRHPLYLGLLLLTISVPIFFANGFMIVVSTIMMFWILNRRMSIEESLMEEKLGSTYLHWKLSRYRFIPFIY